MAEVLRWTCCRDKTRRKVRSCQGSRQKMCKVRALQYQHAVGAEKKLLSPKYVSVSSCVSYRSPAVTPSWVQSSRRTPAWCVEDKTPPVCTTRACTRATVWRQVGYTHTPIHTPTHTIIILSPRGINCSSFRPTRSVDGSRPSLCFASQVLLVSQVKSRGYCSLMTWTLTMATVLPNKTFWLPSRKQFSKQEVLQK